MSSLGATELAAIISLVQQGLNLKQYLQGSNTGSSQEDKKQPSALESLRNALTAGTTIYNYINKLKATPWEIRLHIIAIQTRSFGVALRLHWGGSELLAPKHRKARLAKLLGEDERIAARRRKIERATQFALDMLATRNETAGDTLPSGALLHHPTSSHLYRCLWESFTTYNENFPDEAPDTTPLIDLTRSFSAKTEFERFFREAWLDELLSESGRPIREHLQNLESTERVLSLRTLLIADMARWGEKSVFGHLAEAEFAEMNLGTIYVEPKARFEGAEIPIIDLIHASLKSDNVIAVAADFGHGKSLTARKIAWDIASSYYEKHTASLPLSDIPMPIYIRCQRDIVGLETFDLEKVVRRALHNHSKEIGLDLRFKDQALRPPEASERALFLLDGLDEVLMTSGQIERLFLAIADEASSKHQFVIFTRPAALPKTLNTAKSPSHLRLPIHRLLKFSRKPGGEAETWLRNWKWCIGRTQDSEPSLASLRSRKLDDLAEVPILLLLIAITWESVSAQRDTVDKAHLYEMFFRHLARGKLDRGDERHTHIEEAAKSAKAQLVHMKILEEHQQPIEAMLWLIGRVAWEIWRTENLDGHRIRDGLRQILVDKLKFPESAAELVQMGLFLTLQADLEGQEFRFLFGHQSFKEFSVAFHWRSLLSRARGINSDLKSRRKLEREMGGRYIVGDSACEIISFLEELLGRESSDYRKSVIGWASTTVEDDALIDFSAEQGDDIAFLKDGRALVRLSALTIGCLCAKQEGLRFSLSRPSLLRPLIFWMNCLDLPVRLLAPRLSLAKVDLRGLQLEYLDLSEAEISGARLQSLQCSSGVFSQAIMKGSVFERSILPRADFRHADLTGTMFIHSNLAGAIFKNSTLEHAKFVHSDIERSNFTSSKIRYARFIASDLDGADFRRTSDLEDAQFTKGTTSGVRFSIANDRLNLQFTDDEADSESIVSDPVVVGTSLQSHEDRDSGED